MKRLLLPLLLLSLSGCKYGSYREAREACDEWMKKAKSETIEIPFTNVPGYQYFPGGYKKQRFSRYCDNELRTKKVLGIENDRKINKENVKKRFAY